MPEIPDIRDLAALYRRLAEPYGSVRPEQSREFEEKFELYFNGHPHLKEAFPDEAYRRSFLLARVRSFVRRQVSSENTAGENQSPEAFENLLNGEQKAEEE